MSVRRKTVKRGDKEYSYWEGRTTIGYDPLTGKQIQKYVTASTKAEATRKLHTLIAEIETDTYYEPCRLLLREWLETWVSEYTPNIKDSTRYLYSSDIKKYIIPHLGAVKLENLKPEMIQTFYNELLHPKTAAKKPLSPKSVRCIHSVLHTALNQAVMLGYIPTNPSDACKLPRVDKPTTHEMDEFQSAAFLDAIQDHPHEYLYKIALFTGLREGELLGLTWECVDFNHGLLIVKQQLRRHQQKGGQYYISPTKNGKSRTLVLAPTVLQLFRLQKEKQEQQRQNAGPEWCESGMVFTNPTGGYLSYRTVYDCFKRIVEKLGFPEMRFHDLRHTYATSSLNYGDDIKTLQENLGHSSASFTLDTYGHVSNQMKKYSADRLEQYIQRLNTMEPPNTLQGKK
ncbi:MAG: site-specific integrase [Oscillospiraceae bacterium]|nr:site-specific integrase [Oscillospiraceae bacterium]